MAKAGKIHLDILDSVEKTLVFCAFRFAQLLHKKLPILLSAERGVIQKQNSKLAFPNSISTLYV